MWQHERCVRLRSPTLFWLYSINTALMQYCFVSTFYAVYKYSLNFCRALDLRHRRRLLTRLFRLTWQLCFCLSCVCGCLWINVAGFLRVICSFDGVLYCLLDRRGVGLTAEWSVWPPSGRFDRRVVGCGQWTCCMFHSWLCLCMMFCGCIMYCVVCILFHYNWL